jgi:SAM-dependent methyltransferase
MPKPWYIELYENFPDYDREPYTQGTKGEVDFIEQEIGHDRSKTILDVGCGTGRHALELARRGYRVVGLDLSEALLERGRQVAHAENLDVTFIAGDARALGFEAQFDVALSICEGAFSLMETDEMDLLILENVARALRGPEPAEGKPGGKFILTAPNAAFMLTHDSGEGAFDPVTFREIFTLEATGADGSKKTLHCTQRYYTCPELKWLLKQAGFRAVEFFGVTEAGFDRQVKPSEDHFEIGVIAER